MIKKAEEMVLEMKEQMRGGKGSIEILHILKQDELKGKCRMFAKITVNPGCSIGLHEHDKEEEIFYIIKGKGIFHDNEKTVELKTGDSLLTGGGAKHSVENNNEEPLEMVAVILLY